MTERRFNEAEVAAIFERATEALQSGRLPPPSGDGMTLAELQDIGREVGIEPGLIDEAARMVSQGDRPTSSRSFLGLPLGVERIIELDRRLSDEEWERFVVDLRETFDARGTVRHEGSLRSWTNGNLHAYLEPTTRGYRVRLRTVKGDARGFMVTGLGMSTISAAALIAGTLGGTVTGAGFLTGIGALATMGAGLFAATAVRLPGWARRRRRQMEELAARLAQRTTSQPSPDQVDEA